MEGRGEPLFNYWARDLWEWATRMFVPQLSFRGGMEKGKCVCVARSVYIYIYIQRERDKNIQCGNQLGEHVLVVLFGTWLSQFVVHLHAEGSFDQQA